MQKFPKNKKKKLRLSANLSKQIETPENIGGVAPKMDKEPSDFRISWHYPIRVRLFFAVLIISCILTLIIPLRPTHSDREQRELTKFPKFSFASFFSGEYFDGINTWFADTFPGREGFVNLNAGLQRLYGFGNNKLYGKVDKADDIPDISFPEEPEERTTTQQTTKTTIVTTTTQAPTTAAPTKPATKATAKPTQQQQVAGDDWQKDNVNVPSQNLNGILVRGNSAYEYYSFSTKAANTYAGALKKAASKLSGKATVYDIVIPTSIGVMLDENVRNTISSSDQEKAINYIYGTAGSSVKAVPILQTLRNHNTEYLYFHTDHHWTATGGYYAYVELMNKMGKTANALSSYETKNFDGFRGSFASETNNSGLKTDVVVAYMPHCNTSMYFVDSSGSQVKWSVIQDVTNWSARYKYNTFIGGDNPFTEITNENLADGSACLVVKESFGNALVPFLVDHYQKVYVVDYRYYTDMKIDQFVDTYKVQDVVFANNIGATRSQSLMDHVESFVG